VRQLTRQDTLGIYSDAGACALAESRVSRVTGNVRSVQSGEDITGTDAGELIGVANQQQMCAWCQRLDELIGEEHVEHTRLIDDH
jgi:hypothetical protein